MKIYISLLLLIITIIALSCNNNNASEVHESHNIKDAAEDYADSVNSSEIINDTMKSSPLRVAMGNINGKHIHIEYGSPGVKGRIIWGGLVPYDKVWVTGAHNATNITFGNDVVFGDEKIAAGKYALFTIPGKEKWKVILNKKYDQHLADEYKEIEDVARITVLPEVNDKIVQRLTYTVKQTGEQKGKITMEWEHVCITVPLRFE